MRASNALPWLILAPFVFGCPGKPPVADDDRDGDHIRPPHHCQGFRA
jgi:hypothetical protein